MISSRNRSSDERSAWQAFCDERGEPLTLHEAGERLSRELELDKEMRMYHRRSEIPRCGAVSNASSQHRSAEPCMCARRLHAHTLEGLHFLDAGLRICACQAGMKKHWDRFTDGQVGPHQQRVTKLQTA